jgi:hypothetical protein
MRQCTGSARLRVRAACSLPPPRAALGRSRRACPGRSTRRHHRSPLTRRARSRAAARRRHTSLRGARRASGDGLSGHSPGVSLLSVSLLAGKRRRSALSSASSVPRAERRRLPVTCSTALAAWLHREPSALEGVAVPCVGPSICSATGGEVPADPTGGCDVAVQRADVRAASAR